MNKEVAIIQLETRRPSGLMDELSPANARPRRKQPKQSKDGDHLKSIFHRSPNSQGELDSEREERKIMNEERIKVKQQLFATMSNSSPNRKDSRKGVQSLSNISNPGNQTVGSIASQSIITTMSQKKLMTKGMNNSIMKKNYKIVKTINIKK